MQQPRTASFGHATSQDVGEGLGENETLQAIRQAFDGAHRPFLSPSPPILDGQPLPRLNL